MDEMVERVARALAKTVLAEGLRWDDMARAAITAMREPTEAMWLAGMREDRDLPWWYDTALETSWRDMIDAALAENGQ